MNLTKYVPLEMIPHLKEMGAHDWLTFQHLDQCNTSIFISNNVPRAVKAKAIDIMLKGPDDACLGYAISKAIAAGPKLIRPTLEQCLAMEKTTLNISIKEYRQPFTVVIVELPELYQHTIAENLKTESPASVLLFQNNDGFIFGYSSTPGGESVVNMIPPVDEVLEDRLLAASETGAFVDAAILVKRLALNLCLLMTLSDICQKPANEDQIKRLRRLKNGKNKKDVAKLNAQITAIKLNEVGFSQKVKFYGRRTESQTNCAKRQNSKSSHWRRGHYRRQRCGAKHSETRITFIKPMLIGAARLKGNLSDTSVTYDLRMNPNKCAKRLRDLSAGCSNRTLFRYETETASEKSCNAERRTRMIDTPKENLSCNKESQLRIKERQKQSANGPKQLA